MKYEAPRTIAAGAPLGSKAPLDWHAANGTNGRQPKKDTLEDYAAYMREINEKPGI